MKKSIFFFVVIFLSAALFGAELKVEDLLKSDAEIYKNIKLESGEKVVPKNGYIESLKGEVFIQYDGSESWLQCIEKSKIKEKTTLVTMEKSSAKIKMADGSFINIGAKTKVFFETMKGEPLKEGLSETGIKLFWGKIYSNVKRKVESGAKYEVKTGSVVAGVRGTKYKVTASKTGENEITVYDGIVYVRKTGEELEILLNKNEKIKLGRDGKFEKKMEHRESPPEDGIKDDSIKEQILESGIKTDEKETGSIDADRKYTDEMINRGDEDKSKKTGATLNIYVK